MVFRIPSSLSISSTFLLSPITTPSPTTNTTNDNIQELIFACSPQELEDLLIKLKDGLRTAQNLLGGNK